MIQYTLMHLSLYILYCRSATSLGTNMKESKATSSLVIVLLRGLSNLQMMLVSVDV